MATNNLITWQSVLDNVLHLALNKDQNFQVAPNIVSTAGRLATDILLDEIVRIYPYSQRIVDKAKPFLKRKLVNVDNGICTLPDDYRNLLSVSIPTNPTQTDVCSCSKEECEKFDDPCDTVPEKAAVRKEKCYFQPVRICDTDQFDDASQSDLYPPSLKQPIGMFVGTDSNSKTLFKICPIEGINYVEVRYIKMPDVANIGYTIMADDTWQINTASSEYSPLQWETTASPEFFKIMSTLLGIHIRDGNFINWNNELKKIGLF